MEKFLVGLTFFAITFCVIVSPIVAILSLACGIEQSFAFLLTSLISVAVIIIMFVYWITGRKVNDTNRERMKNTRTVANIVTIVVAVCLLPGTWSISEDGKQAKRKMDSYDSYSYNRTYSSYDSRSSSSFGTSSYGTGSPGNSSDSQKESSPKSSTSKKNYSYSGSTSNKFKKSPYQAYDDGYEAVYEDDDYDTDRYNSDDDYASGVDDALDDLEEEGEEW